MPTRAGRAQRIGSVVLALCAGLSARATTPARPGSVQGHVAVKGGGQRTLVVSLERPGLDVRAPETPVTMGQKGLQFVPHVLVVVRGTTVRFENDDPELHNVYSPDGQYDLGTWRRGEMRERRFDVPGVYAQRCRLHPDMTAYVVVLATPYFALTGTDGRFRIGGVPPGTYTLRVWDHSLDGIEREVVIAPGQALGLNLLVER